MTGSIGRISDDRRHVEVQGVEIELDRHTRFSGRYVSGSLRSARDLRQGASVTASLVPTTSGTLRAAEVRPASGALEAGEDQELKGVVTAVSDAAWTIDGKVFTITDQTRFEGDPGVGDFVEVKYHDDGTGASIADRIEIEDGATGAEVEFGGIVEAIGGDAWTISGPWSASMRRRRSTAARRSAAPSRSMRRGRPTDRCWRAGSSSRTAPTTRTTTMAAATTTRAITTPATTTADENGGSTSDTGTGTSSNSGITSGSGHHGHGSDDTGADD